MAATGSAAPVPRNFKLLDELEDAERSQEGGADISLGLTSMEDRLMNNWQASIVAGAGGSQDVRMWFLDIVVGADYPKVPPTFKFKSKVAMDCVDSKGNVDAAKVPYLKDWTADKSLRGSLAALKAAIGSASSSQPEDGETY